MGPLTVAPWGKWYRGFEWSRLNEAKSWRWIQESCSLAGTRFNVLTEPDVFCLSPLPGFSPRWTFCVWPAFFIHLDGVSQCSLLDATYGLSFSKGLSALSLEPHLLLLLLHKQWFMVRSEGFCSPTDPAVLLHSGQGDMRLAVETFRGRKLWILD